MFVAVGDKKVRSIEPDASTASFAWKAESLAIRTNDAKFSEEKILSR
jgi:hypothetical protein